MKLFFTFILLLVINNPYLSNSEELPYYVGFEGTYGLLLFDANFTEFKGIESCGCYESGNGTNLRGRIFAEYAVLDFLNIGLHAGYQTKSGLLNNIDTAFARNLKTEKVELVNTNKQLDIVFNSLDLGLDISVLIKRDLFNGPLYFSLSPSINFQQNGKFTQTEVINRPSEAAFKIDDKIFFERINAEGELTTLSSNIFSFNASLYNNMKIAHNLYFTQKIGLTSDINSLLTDAEIRSYSLFGTLGIKFAFDSPKEIIPKLPPKPPIQPLPIETIPLPLLSLDSKFDYVNSYIEIGEKLIASPPLVLAIFFDKNSSEIRKSYNNGPKETNLIEDYYNIFDRIVEILNKYPESEIILQGSTSGPDEKNDINLAKERVKNTKAIFIEKGITENRIKTRYNINPKVITNIQYEEGLEENRRVEIDLMNANSVEFVKKIDFELLHGYIDNNIELENTTGNVYFENNLNEHEKLIKSEVIKTKFIKDLKNEKFNFTIDSKLNYEELTVNVSEKVKLERITKKQVELKTDEFEALLMFDFASSNLSDETKSLLKQLVEYLPEGKTIEIIGNSDNIGLEDANKKIAKERATNAIEFIKNNTSKVFYFEELTNTEKYDEKTPQGRYLNRSIKIRIK